MADVLEYKVDDLGDRVAKVEKKLEDYHEVASPTHLRKMEASIDSLKKTVWMASGALVIFQVIFVPILIKVIAG